MLVMSPLGAAAADLRIIDSRGTEVVLREAAVDYGGFLASDKETEGIRVLYGDGSVTVKWADVDSLRVVRQDDSAKPPRIELEIVLRSGKKVAATLFRQGQMKLLGTMDLGDYSIDLEKVRTISPVR
jgi:hypothetical protein